MLLAVACLGCCPAWPPNADGVQIADQEVLIYWDSANGIEHFVRRADFEAESLPDDFGFLVPSPTRPTLSETPDMVFTRLSAAIRPEIVYEKKYLPSFVPVLAIPFLQSGLSVSASSESAGKAAIELLETVFVAGFEASVLRATDVDALVAWLEENGYDARPALRDWLTPYIEKQWIVTAFKFDCDPKLGRRSLSREAVCMSFKTDRPFFPYRVPTDQEVLPEKGLLLRLYYAGDERNEAHFETRDGPWSATTKFSASVKNASNLLAGVGNSPSDSQAAITLPETIWLTTFEDNTWPGSGGTGDLYFEPSADQAEMRPPPIIRYNKHYIWIPPDVLLGIGFLIAWFVRRRRRHRDAVTSA